MHAEKLVPAVIAAVAVACLLFAGRAHGLEGYVPAAASQQQVEEPLAINKNDEFLPQPEVMPVPTQLFRRPGFAVYAPQREEATTQPGADANLAGSLDGYFRQPTMTEPEPAAEITTEPEAEPAPETTKPEPEDEPAAPAMATKREPVTPTAPGQGDFYRTGETPTSPEPPAKPSSPSSDDKSSYSGGGGGGDNKQVDDDGEPVDGLSPKAIDNILKEHNAFRAQEGERPLTWNTTVAKYAQQYAEQRKGDCALKHSTGPYGENLMYGDGKSWTWRHTVDEWSEEKKNYHYTTNTCDAGKMCGHYTAVVWKDTTSVGCGRVTCTSGNTLMVCSYYPPGNYDGEKPY
ncbi:uncharacterized protein [Lolium perenne]|uniref:uncharacterized protein n=1 Tax=Lolium perenne TaxID=4522 RepID=UPI0021EA8B33|nr:probable pathogenesis-related protein CaO19.6200 [Lolium perenne]